MDFLRRLSNAFIRRLLDGPRTLREEELPDWLSRDIGLLDGRATVDHYPRGQARMSRWPTTQEASPPSMDEKRCDSQPSSMPCGNEGSSRRAAA